MNWTMSYQTFRFLVWLGYASVVFLFVRLGHRCRRNGRGAPGQKLAVVPLDDMTTVVNSNSTQSLDSTKAPLQRCHFASTGLLAEGLIR